MNITKIVALFKSGDEYRFTMITDQFHYSLNSTKLFDKVLTDFVKKGNILSDLQYGFRNTRSTSTAQLDFVEKLSIQL